MEFYMKKAKSIGVVKTGQVTVGAQIGGQAYREVIFFENKDALDRMKESKTEFSSQISAVAVKSGVSKNAKYADGVSGIYPGSWRPDGRSYRGRTKIQVHCFLNRQSCC